MNSSATTPQSQQPHCFVKRNSSAKVSRRKKSGDGLTKKAKITDEHRAEAVRLKAIWDVDKPCTQAEFGEQYEIGNQSAVGQFLRGESPLSMKAALGFSRGLGAPISAFSTRLAREAEAMGQAAGGEAGAVSSLSWPFKTVTPAQYRDLLTEQNKATIESMVFQLVSANIQVEKQETTAQETGKQRAA
jgi:hypothetical protein